MKKYNRMTHALYEHQRRLRDLNHPCRKVDSDNVTTTHENSAKNADEEDQNYTQNEVSRTIQAVNDDMTINNTFVDVRASQPVANNEKGDSSFPMVQEGSPSDAFLTPAKFQ